MKTSLTGRKYIESKEGLVLYVYDDAVGPKVRLTPSSPIRGFATVGYGHKVRAGEDFWAGITEAQADALMSSDLAWAESAVDRLISADLTQPQFDALVSITFNAGSGWLAQSDVRARLDQGDVQGAADAFLEVCHTVVDGVKIVSPVLLARRQEERAMFLSQPSSDMPS